MAKPGPRKTAQEPRLRARVAALLGEPAPTTAAGTRTDWKRLAERLVQRVQQAEETALLRAERMSALIGSIDEIVFESDADGTYLNIWTANESLLVRPKQEMLGKKREAVLSQELSRQLVSAFRRVLASGESESIEYALPIAGQERWFLARINPIPEPEGPPRTVCMLARDISERKRAEELLAESEQRYRQLFELESDAIFLIDNETGHILEVNGAATTLYGYSRQEFLSMRNTDVSAEPDSTRQAMRAGLNLVPLRYHRRKDGVVIPVEITARHYSWRGRPVHIAAIRDITERVRAEQEREQQRAFLRKIIDADPNIITVKDHRGRYILANRALTVFYGVEVDEVIGKTPLQLPIAPDEANKIHREDLAILEGRRAGLDHEHMLLDPRGREIWAHTIKLPLKNAAGEVEHVVGYTSDITHLKRTEEALRASEAHYRLLFMDNPMPMLVYDVETLAILSANEAAVRHYGYSRAEFHAMTVAQLRPPEDVPRFLDYLRHTEQAVHLAGVWRHKKKDGSLIDVNIESHESILADRKVRIVLINDVTEPLRAERVLRESEERFRTLFDLSADGILILDLDRTMLMVNEQFCQRLGYTRDELLGRNVAEIEEPEGVQQIPHRHDQVVRDGRMVFETFHRHKHGARVAFEVNVRLFEFGGQPAFLAVCRDITERRSIEEAARSYQRQITTLMDTLPAYAFFKDTESVYRVANRQFCTAVGCAPEAIAGKTDDDLFPRELADKYRRDDHRVLSTGRMLVDEEEMIEGDRRLTVEVRKVPLRDEQGKVVGLIGMGFDITQRKRAEEDRIRLEAQVQNAQKLESLGVLAGGIAHDFNNLLTGILGHADLALLELSPLSPARDSIRQIETSARRAAELTRQMLAYSGRGKFVIQAVQIHEVVEEMSHLLEISISKKCVLKYHFAENLPAIEADVTQLRQVVMNLIINASEAIGDKSGAIVVSTGAMECDRNYLAGSYLDEDLPEGVYVYLEVADTGSGMTPETLARIFDPFFTTKFTGRGLGLAAVLGIVRGHRGAIKVYSEPGRGTTFKVLFPASSRPAQTGTARVAEPESWHGQGLILVVDDEETVRTLAKRMLERLGFTVLLASDGQEAVEIFRQHAADIQAVLLDMTMPHMDGEEAFRELRRIRSDVCVVLSSGYNEQDATNRFAGKGLAGFIQKPYRLEDLALVMRRALGE